MTNPQNKWHCGNNIKHIVYASNNIKQETLGLFVNRNTINAYTALAVFLISLHCGVERLAAGQTGTDLKLDSKSLVYRLCSD